MTDRSSSLLVLVLSVLGAAPALAQSSQPASPAATVAPVEPLAGFSDGTAFLRAPDGGFVLFPSGRLQTDGYFFHSDDKTPNPSFLLRRARLELSGWVGSFVFFTIQGDFASGPPAAANPVAPANVATTDAFVALAPRKNLAILQVGQFDAPFTLENRTSDKYFDFMERSITVRAFGIPTNKEVGAMLHGFNDERNFHYALAVLDGDGQNFKNADRSFDVMGRAWVAPFSFRGPAALHDVAVGGSFWTGNRGNTLPLAAQTTQGGFTFLNPAFTWTNGAAKTPVELHQVGRMNGLAFELNAPVDHRLGVRTEVVWKHSPLSAEDVTSAKAPTILGGVNLRGVSAYGEAWWWLVGDDRIVGDQQGLQPYARWKAFAVRPPESGVMLAARVEHLSESITDEPDAAALMLGSPVRGRTTVTSYELGVNYWHSKRFRATFNYVVNRFGGDTTFVKKLASQYEQELLFRLGIAL